MKCFLAFLFFVASAAYADSVRTVPADVFQVNVIGNHVTLTAPSLSASYSVVLPTAQGAANQCMVNDGSGNLSWIRPITGLTGDVTASGSGVSTIALVGGQTAANVAVGAVLANAATPGAVNAAIVRRDGSGNFSATTVTANLTGNASGSAGSFTGSLAGDVTGTQGATVVAFVGGQSAAAVSSAATTVQAATSGAVNSTLVKRDTSGNFSAGTITATLNGSATSAGSFSGSLAGDVTGAQGSTVVALVGGQTAAAVSTATATVQAATSGAVNSTLVARDGSGNFSAGTITGSLSGNATNVTGTVTVPHGGTGDTSFTTNALLTGNNTSAINIVTNNASATNEFLTQSSSGAPAWATILAADVPNISAAKITSGQLAVAQGGTGVASVTSNGVVIGAGTSPVVTATGAASSVLRVPDAGGTPAFGAINVSSGAAVTGTLAVGNGGTGDTSFTVNSVVVGNSTSALNIVTNNASATNEFLTQSSSGAPAWAALVAGDVPSISAAKITSGQLAIAQGGTNAATSQAAINNISQLTTKGDIQIFDGTNSTRFASGADGTVLSSLASAGGGLSWITPLTNPMTTAGDIIIGGASGAANRLAAGTGSQVFREPDTGGTAAWGALNIASGAAVTGILSVSNGGTGKSSLTSNGVVIGSGTSAVVLATGAATTFLQGGSPPSFAQINLTSGAGVQANVGQIGGTPTNDSATVGNIGERITQSRIRSNRGTLTTNTPVNVTNTIIVLSAGDWDITGTACFYGNTGASFTEFEWAISKTSATFPAADTIGVATSGEYTGVIDSPAIVPGNNTDICYAIPPVQESLSTSTTVYFVMQATFTVGAAQYFGSYTARRIR